MASKSGRKRRQLEDRLALARDGKSVSSSKPPAAAASTPQTRDAAAPVRSAPASSQGPPSSVLHATEARPAARREVEREAPRVQAPSAPAPDASGPLIPVATTPVAAEAPSTVRAPWRGSGAVDITLGAPRIQSAGQPPVAATVSVWPGELSSRAAPSATNPRLPGDRPTSLAAQSDCGAPGIQAAPADGDDPAFVLARIESRLEALSQWAQEFSAWQGRRDGVPAEASRAKQRLVLAMLALFLPLFALLIWRLVGNV